MYTSNSPDQIYQSLQVAANAGLEREAKRKQPSGWLPSLGHTTEENQVEPPKITLYKAINASGNLFNLSFQLSTLFPLLTSETVVQADRSAAAAASPLVIEPKRGK